MSSGSVSDEMLELCNSELYNVWKAGGDIDYISWDQEVDSAGAKEYDGKLKIERTQCGGTDLNSAIVYANENYKKNNWNFCIITTDGYIPNITIKAKIPTMILITPDGVTNFGNPFNYKVVKMQKW